MGAAHDQASIITRPCPCDSCQFRERCASQHLACARFSMFVHNEAAQRWRAAPCAPTAARYAALFAAADRRWR
jgi:hypothetical protein